MLEKSDFNDVFKTLKVSKTKPLIKRTTNGSGSSICFITKDNIVLEFKSFTNTEHGFTKYIEEISLYTSGHSNIRFDQKKCSRISLKSSDLKFKNKIGLDTKKQAIYDHLGSPMKEINGSFFTPDMFGKTELGFYFHRNRIFQGMEAYYFFKKVEDNLGETLVVRVGYNEKNLVNMISAKKTTHGLSDDKGFSLQGIVLEKSDFNDVFKTLKVSKTKPFIKRTADGSGNSICFITKDNMFLEFWSSVTMSAGKYITEINLYTSGHSNIRFDQKKCSRISLKSNDLKFKNKIGLNTKKQAIYDHLGSPMKESLDGPSPRSKIFQEMEGYYFRNNVRNNYSEYLTVEVGYNEKSLVNMISVNKTTMN